MKRLLELRIGWRVGIVGIVSVEKWPLLPRDLDKTTRVEGGNKNAAKPGRKKVEKNGQK